MNRNRILLTIVGVVILILVAVWWVYLLTPRAEITIRVAPTELQIANSTGKTKFSGTYKNNQKITVTPGDYTFTLSRSEFESYTTTLSLKDGDKKELLTVLTPKTDAARALLESDEAQDVIEQWAGTQKARDEKILTENYPILSLLPIKARLYRVDACPSEQHPGDNTKIALCIITRDASLKPYALEAIREAGYNPDDFEIILQIKN